MIPTIKINWRFLLK